MTHEEPYTRYDYSDQAGFSPLGAEVLMAEQSALDSAERLPKKLGEFTKAYVEHDSSKTEEELAEQFASQALKMSPDGESGLLRLELDARTEQAGIKLSEEKMVSTLAEVRSQLSALDLPSRTKVESNLLQALVTPANESTLATFLRWKGDTDIDQGLPWAEWLSRKPEEGGASDEQLRNILQWNEYEFRRYNLENAESLRLHELAFEDGLRRAVAAGDIDQAVLDNYINQPKPPVHIADPLNLQMINSQGYVHQDRYAGHVHGRSIILERYWSSDVYVHERSHTLGRFTIDRDLNEATTDIVGGTIYEHSILKAVDNYKKIYDPEMRVLRGFMRPAGMEDLELSRLYAKRDSPTFIERLDKGARNKDVLADMDELRQIATEANARAGMPTDEVSVYMTMAAVIENRQGSRPANG